MADTDFIFYTVVNNGVLVPGTDRLFNSYNQPSVNADGVVAFRARSQGGMGQPATGIFLGDSEGGPVQAITVRGGLAPQPNNTGATFNEFPSFPRIDRDSDMVAFRGQSTPVYVYEVPASASQIFNLAENTANEEEVAETRIGTSGVYSNPKGPLITGASQLGVPDLPEFNYFSVPVPGAKPEDPPIRFDQFPGAPSPTNDIIAFKGNWTLVVDGKDEGQTGVYFRDLDALGGESPVQFIADSNTEIPGVSGVEFGSTAPPTAAGEKVVFLGVDNEDDPLYGGIYLSDLNGDPTTLTTVVSLGVSAFPGGPVLTTIEEVLSFDGRSVAWWGAWGEETLTQLISCPAEGNKDRLAYCMDLSEDDPLDPDDPYDPDGIGNGNFLKEIPRNQGIFITDTSTMTTELVVQTGEDFDTFLFFNFSGRPPGVGEGGHGGESGVLLEEGDDDDLEGDFHLARWRESAFMALDGYDLAFKAAKLNLVDVSDPMLPELFSADDPPGDFENDVYIESAQGIYYLDLMGSASAIPVAYSGMDGGFIDPMAEGLPVVSLGLERDGLRNGNLVFAASMAAEVADAPGGRMAMDAMEASHAFSFDSPSGHDGELGEEEEVDTWAGIYGTQVSDRDGGGFNVINGTDGKDELIGSLQNDLIRGLDDDDRLKGRAGNDFLAGGNGDDLVDGGLGDDVVQGDSGNDKVRGGAGNDRLFGGGGRDLLIGNLGNDFLDGGEGDDIIKSGKGLDVIALSPGDDTVLDFNVLDDRIGVMAGQDYSLAQVVNGLLITHDTGSMFLRRVDLGAFEANNPVVQI